MFRQDKATQMAAKFLTLSNKPLPYLLLIKMLYKADREMLLKHGKPITYDQWYAMEFGPVLSSTLDLIRAGANESTYWSDHISTVGYDVALKSDPGDDDLSRAEDAIIEQTFREWGHMDKWDVVDITHTFPEWENPGKSSTPIAYKAVLKINGFSREDSANILGNIEMQNDVWALTKTEVERVA